MSEQLGATLAARKRDARIALSELFLDTALDDNDFSRLSACLQASSLGIDELERIYADELAPVLYRNLTSPSGEWSGFDPDWLESEIEKNTGPGGVKQHVGWLGALKRYWVTRQTHNDWQRLKRLLEAGSSE